jgi:hypothetical protein
MPHKLIAIAARVFLGLLLFGAFVGPLVLALCLPHP